jgi:hypothetical protein
MRKLLFACILILAACGNVDASTDAPVVRASAFIYDPASPVVVRGKFVYDPNAPVLRAQRFIIEK